jgi:hypothetical protein
MSDHRIYIRIFNESLHHMVFHMNEPDLDLEPVISPRLVCNNCRINVAEIFQESGEFCLHCWQERTYPNL